MATALAISALACGANAHAVRGKSDEELARTPPNTTVGITLVLRLPGRDALDEYVHQQSTAPEPRWLTAGEIGERFGLRENRIDAVVARLDGAGLTVTRRFDQRTALLAEGPARAVERLFSLRLNEYAIQGDGRYLAPSRPPRVPADLADAVTAVLGLDSRPVWEPKQRSAAAPTGAGNDQGGGLGPLGPVELSRAYGYESLHGDGFDGQGQTVAVVSLGTLRGKEVALWEERFGLPAGRIEHIAVRPRAPRPKDRKWDPGFATEVALDLQMIRAVAPGAVILNYSTRNDLGSITRAVDAIVDDGRTRVVSVSYGLCEPAMRDEIVAQDASYAAAAAAGVNIFVASGDDGAHDCYRAADPPDLRIAVDWPSASAHVIGVGGTTLFHGQDGTHQGEVAWASPTSYSGAGGGVSEVVRQPAWQQGPGVANEFSDGGRQVPDVAGPADPASNLEIVFWEDGDYYAGMVGGTSAAAPFWAGSVALAQQSLASVGVAVLGDLKPFLYAVASSGAYQGAFYDVTVGRNDYFLAGTGWDYITGLGSPRVGELARLVVEVRLG